MISTHVFIRESGRDVAGLFADWSTDWQDTDEEKVAELIGVHPDQIRAVGVLSRPYAEYPAGCVCALVGYPSGEAIHIMPMGDDRGERN